MALGSAAIAATTARSGEALVDIEITLQGVGEVSRRLRAKREAMQDLTPAWPAVDEVLRDIARQEFASEGAQGGEPWQGLAPRTQNERRRLGYGPAHPILQRTQRLARSLTSLTGDTITVHKENYYAFGTAVEYFKYHQSKLPRTRLPRRAMLVLTADDKNEIMRPIRVHLRGGDPSRRTQARDRHASSFQQTTGGAL